MDEHSVATCSPWHCNWPSPHVPPTTDPGGAVGPSQGRWARQGSARRPTRVSPCPGSQPGGDRREVSAAIAGRCGPDSQHRVPDDCSIATEPAWASTHHAPPPRGCRDRAGLRFPLAHLSVRPFGAPIGRFDPLAHLSVRRSSCRRRGAGRPGGVPRPLLHGDHSPLRNPCPVLLQIYPVALGHLRSSWHQGLWPEAPADNGPGSHPNRHGPRHHRHLQPGSGAAAEPGRDELADLGLRHQHLPLDLRRAGDLPAVGGRCHWHPRWRGGRALWCR